MEDSPEVAILQNDAALHALKRPQLLALTKRFGLKGAGKNTDLVARLKEHGAFLLAQSGEASVLHSTGDPDASTASWAVVNGAAVPEVEDLAEFGAQGVRSAQSTLTGSSSSTSLAGTIREKGATLLRALVDSGRRDEPIVPVQGSLYPALPAQGTHEPSCGSENARTEDEERYQDEDEADGGIRLVSSRSTVHDTTMASVARSESPPPSVPHATPAFIFGSPTALAAPPASAFTFSSMPGTLFASTSSTASYAAANDAAPAPPAPATAAMDSIMAEMNRRAAESRATAPLPQRGSSLFAPAGPAPSPNKGSKAAFDASHKRRFDKMDSITTHWAAKRALPSSSSISCLAGMARSGSSRSIADAASGQTQERAPKRLKPSTSKPFGLSRLASSGASSSSASTDYRLVSALRDEGWSAAPQVKTTVSLSSSVRTQPRTKEVREDVKPVAEQERAQRRRQLELARARRKSQAASGMGLAKRRPSLGVGPKPPGSTASRLFKLTVRKFTPSSLSSSAARPPLPTSTSARSLAPTASTRTLQTSTSGTIPRFAASTAASSSRSALATTTSTTSPPKKAQPGWKKFDLQASLQRPMTWKPHLGATPASPASPAVPRPSAAFASAPKRTAPTPGSLKRTTSARVANAALLSSVRPAPVAEKPLAAAATATVEEQLAALPAAPTASFEAPLPASTLQPITNVAAPLSGAQWQPPAVTKKPVLPTAWSSSSAPGPGPSTKKHVSSSTGAARGGAKARGKAQIEGLESRARKVRAASVKAKERAAR